jgi:hypothetical protein
MPQNTPQCQVNNVPIPAIIRCPAHQILAGITIAGLQNPALMKTFIGWPEASTSSDQLVCLAT